MNEPRPTPRVEEIRLTDIYTDLGTQSRVEGLLESKVEEYMELMAGGVEFPPVRIFHDRQNRHILVGGFHRVEARKRRGYVVVKATVEDGELRDAILASKSENTDHGQPRSRKDKRAAVLALLQDPEWSQWADREIARRTGTSNTFVGNLRDELRLAAVAAGNVDSPPEETVRTYVRDGETRTMDVSNIGAKAADEYPFIPEPPDELTGRKRIDALTAWFGLVPDAVIARKAGVQASTLERYRLSVVRFDEGEVLRLLDPVRHLIGTMPDEEIAALSNTTASGVEAYRLLKGIDPFVSPFPTPSAAVTPPGCVWGLGQEPGGRLYQELRGPGLTGWEKRLPRILTRADGRFDATWGSAADTFDDVDAASGWLWALLHVRGAVDEPAPVEASTAAEDVIEEDEEDALDVAAPAPAAAAGCPTVTRRCPCCGGSHLYKLTNEGTEHDGAFMAHGCKADGLSQVAARALVPRLKDKERITVIAEAPGILLAAGSVWTVIGHQAEGGGLGSYLLQECELRTEGAGQRWLDTNRRVWRPAAVVDAAIDGAIKRGIHGLGVPRAPSLDLEPAPSSAPDAEPASPVEAPAAPAGKASSSPVLPPAPPRRPAPEMATSEEPLDAVEEVELGEVSADFAAAVEAADSTNHRPGTIAPPVSWQKKLWSNQGAVIEGAEREIHLYEVVESIFWTGPIVTAEQLAAQRGARERHYTDLTGYLVAADLGSVRGRIQHVFTGERVRLIYTVPEPEPAAPAAAEWPPALLGLLKALRKAWETNSQFTRTPTETSAQITGVAIVQIELEKWVAAGFPGTPGEPTPPVAQLPAAAPTVAAIEASVSEPMSEDPPGEPEPAPAPEEPAGEVDSLLTVGSPSDPLAGAIVANDRIAKIRALATLAEVKAIEAYYKVEDVYSDGRPRSGLQKRAVEALKQRRIYLEGVEGEAASIEESLRLAQARLAELSQTEGVP